MVFLVPENTSPILRQFIVSLFITHGETKLNAIGNLLAARNTDPPFPQGSFRGNWCHSLINRSSLSSTLTKAEPTARDESKY